MPINRFAVSLAVWGIVLGLFVISWPETPRMMKPALAQAVRCDGNVGSQLAQTFNGGGCPSAAGCSMAFDAVGPAGSPPGFSGTGLSSPITWTHPGGASATAVAVGMQAFSRTVTAITYGGTAMTLGASVTDSNGAVDSIYGLTNLGGLGLTGSQTVSISYNAGGASVEAGSISVTCSNTTTVFDNANTATGTSTTPTGPAITSTTAEIIVDVLGTSTSGAGTFSATGTGQTIKWGQLAVGGDTGAGSTMPGQAGTTTPTWSLSGVSSVFGIAAASFKHQ